MQAESCNDSVARGRLELVVKGIKFVNMNNLHDNRNHDRVINVKCHKEIV